MILFLVWVSVLVKLGILGTVLAFVVIDAILKNISGTSLNSQSNSQHENQGDLSRQMEEQHRILHEHMMQSDVEMQNQMQMDMQRCTDECIKAITPIDQGGYMDNTLDACNINDSMMNVMF